MTPMPIIDVANAPSKGAITDTHPTTQSGGADFARTVKGETTGSEHEEVTAEAITFEADAEPAVELVVAQIATSRDRSGADDGLIGRGQIAERIVPEIAGKEIAQKGTTSDDGLEENATVAPDRKDKAAGMTAVQALVQGRLPMEQSDVHTKERPQPSKPALVDGPIEAAMPNARDRVGAVGIAPENLNAATRTLTMPDHPVKGAGRDQLIKVASKSQSAAPAAVINQGFVGIVQVVPSVLATHKLQQVLASGEVEGLQGFVAPERQAVTGQGITSTTATAGSETGRLAAQQIAVAITTQNGRSTEIALNPEELGRVRLRMTAIDSTINLNVLAERPETADLLRRHIDALAQEFRTLGYDDITFSFGDQAAGQQDAQTSSGMAQIEVLDGPQSPTQTVDRSMSGLDLRL